ncbi:MAG: hypothetical protein JWM86_347 [Thermoleophilia bacterium]|nr:hypothetical protein [Thermoleophilia bacterium]
MTGGWLVTSRVQQTVAIVPGLDGCARLTTSAERIECLSDEFADGAAQSADGATGARRDERVIEYVRRAETLARGNPTLADTCHPSMHRLGRREGARAGAEGRTPTFPGGSSQLCTAGYVHGLAEGYLARTPNIDAAKIFPGLCHDPSSKPGCAHGIGHALLRSVPNRSADNTSPALTDCETLPENFIASCRNGVYMESAMRTGEAVISPARYAAGCGASESVERALSCWSYLPQSLTAHDVPLDEYPGWCARSTLPGQFTCIEAYGRQLGVEGSPACGRSGDIPELRQRCIEGAIGLQVGSGHVSPAEARSTCGGIKDSSLVAYCRRAVERYSSGRAKVEADA